MIWKELNTNVEFGFLRPVAVMLIWSFLCFTILLSLSLLVDLPSSQERVGNVTNPIVRGAGTVLVSFTLLFIALSAAHRISRERERRTLDGLLLTPLDREEILFTKCLGSIWSVRWILFFLAPIWALGLITGGLHVAALPLVLSACLVFAGFMASLGLWFSMVSRTTLRATMFTLLASLVFIVGPGLYMKTVGGRSFSRLGAEPAWDELLLDHGLTPPVNLWTLSFHTGDFKDGDPEPIARIMASLVGLHFYMLLIVILWASMLYRLRSETGPPARR